MVTPANPIILIANSLESIFPRHIDTNWCAILVGQQLPVQAHGQDRQRMHRLVHAQALDIWPVEHREALPGHLLRVVQGRETQVPGARGRLEALDQVAEREADPRHHHRPGLDATQPVDALFERMWPQQVVQRIGPGDLGLAVNGHVPRAGPEVPGVLGWITLVGAELVEVVVAGNLRQRVLLLVGRVAGIGRRAQGAHG